MKLNKLINMKLEFQISKGLHLSNCFTGKRMAAIPEAWY